MSTIPSYAVQIPKVGFKCSQEELTITKRKEKKRMGMLKRISCCLFLFLNLGFACGAELKVGQTYALTQKDLKRDRSVTWQYPEEYQEIISELDRVLKTESFTIIGEDSNRYEIGSSPTDITGSFVSKERLNRALEVGIIADYDSVKKARQKKQEEAGKKRAEEIRAKNWSPHITAAVLNGKILLGMTEEQVLAARGKPQRINRTVSHSGIHEQWIYGSTYLYFQDGRLVSWQDSR